MTPITLRRFPQSATATLSGAATTAVLSAAAADIEIAKLRAELNATTRQLRLAELGLQWHRDRLRKSHHVVSRETYRDGLITGRSRIPAGWKVCETVTDEIIKFHVVGESAIKLV